MQTDDKLAILITGKSLQFVMEDETSRAIFLQLCRIAKVVIACRVIPSQKVGERPAWPRCTSASIGHIVNWG